MRSSKCAVYNAGKTTSPHEFRRVGAALLISGGAAAYVSRRTKRTVQFLMAKDAQRINKGPHLMNGRNKEKKLTDVFHKQRRERIMKWCSKFPFPSLLSGRCIYKTWQRFRIDSYLRGSLGDRFSNRGRPEVCCE